jgi:hypothetical protein
MTEDGLSADSASAPDMVKDLVIRVISPSFTIALYLAHRGKGPDMAFGVPRVWALSLKLQFCSQPGRPEHPSSLDLQTPKVLTLQQLRELWPIESLWIQETSCTIDQIHRFILLRWELELHFRVYIKCHSSAVLVRGEWADLCEMRRGSARVETCETKGHRISQSPVPCPWVQSGWVDRLVHS